MTDQEGRMDSLLRQALTERADGAISADRDLWPRIAGEVRASGGRTKRSRSRRLLHASLRSSASIAVTSLALIFLVLASLLHSHIVRLGTSSPTAATSCRPATVVFADGYRCYVPARRADAEANLAFLSVDPTAAVSAMTGLRLTHVTTTAGAGLGPPYGGIVYTFGTIPGSGGALPMPVPATPRFVSVHEEKGHGPIPATMTSYVGGRGSAPLPRGPVGPWQFHAAASTGPDLTVISNLDERTVSAIGHKLLQLSRAQGGTGEASVSVTSHGIRLTLSIPSHIYPRNALVLAIVRIQNVSRVTRLESPIVEGLCERHLASISVRDQAGQYLNLLPPPPIGFPQCPAPPLYQLKPGEMREESILVVLQGQYLQATSNVNTSTSMRAYMGTDITTPRLAVGIPASTPPTVRFVTSDGNTEAVITRPQGATGSLHYYQWSACKLAIPVWSTTTGNRVSAGCAPRPGEWHLVAGWLGYPAVILNGAKPVMPGRQ